MNPIGTTANLFLIGEIVATSPIRKNSNYLSFWPVEAKREANGRMAKMIGNSNLRGCGNEFADLKKTGCRANRIHLWAEFRSEDNSSNMAQRFWPVSMDPGRVLDKVGRERRQDRANLQDF